MSSIEKESVEVTGVITGIAILLLIISGFTWLFTKANESAEQNREEYISIISTMLKEQETLDKGRSWQVAECVYEQDKGVLSYRNKLEQSQDMSPVSRSYKPFLVALRESVNGETTLLREESDRIERAIETCLE